MSDVKVLERRALEIRRRYDQLNKSRGGEPWDARKLANGFKKDVAELVAIIEQKPTNMKKLNHELADCLWSVLIIARKVDVDIEKAFWDTMSELDKRFDEDKA